MDAHHGRFPMAGALWAYESKRDDKLHARQAQMFHLWEAAIQFHATAVLSALLQDRSALERELPILKDQFNEGRVTPERATLGVCRTPGCSQQPGPRRIA